MADTPIKIKFTNTVNPNSTFDILKLEDVYNRENLDHDIEKLHKVEFFLLLLITEGKGKHTIDFTDYNLKKGSLLTIRKDQIHKFFKREDLKGYLLLFTDDFLVSYLEKLEAQKSLQLFNELLGTPKTQLSDIEHIKVIEIIDLIETEYFKIMDNYSL